MMMMIIIIIVLTPVGLEEHTFKSKMNFHALADRILSFYHNRAVGVGWAPQRVGERAVEE